MKKTTIKHLVALLFMLMAAASASAQKEAYAVYTSNDSILAFYYDDQISSRQGEKYYLNTGDSKPDWSFVIPLRKEGGLRPLVCRSATYELLSMVL